jgi:hypothetical protein
MTSASRGRVAGATALFFTLMATAALAAPARTTVELATDVDKATIEAVHSRIRVSSGSGAKAAGDLVGEMCVGEGPNWQSNPECKNCLEACAIKFGGSSSDYECSTSNSTINNNAHLSGWGDQGLCFGNGAAEDFKVGAFYSCGGFGCSYSAWVQDNCAFGGPPCSNGQCFCYEAGGVLPGPNPIPGPSPNPNPAPGVPGAPATSGTGLLVLGGLVLATVIGLLVRRTAAA